VPYVVTGISQDGDTAALEQALKSAGLSLEVFEVLGPDDADTLATGGHIDTAIITGGGLETGTGVPGITGGMIPGVTASPRGVGVGPDDGDSIWDRLADLAIPDDEVENYAEAIEAGRSIIAYHGDAKSVTTVEGIFTSAGLAKIKTF
jgi:hypothetical protein